MSDSSDWLFLREKPTLALLAIYELDRAYAAIVAKRIDSTFPYTSNILSQLEEQGLIRVRPEGRVRYLELTGRGRKVALGLKSLMDTLRAPGIYQKKAERLKEIISSNTRGSEIRLGPLRRDLIRLKRLGDEELARTADELDRMIHEALLSSHA
jgi:DNA-binding MarR family transcriptional regulator